MITRMEATSTLLTAIDLYKFSIHKIFLSSPSNSFYFVGTCMRVRMGIPNSQLTTIFSAKYQLTTIFLANSQLTSNCS